MCGSVMLQFKAIWLLINTMSVSLPFYKTDFGYKLPISIQVMKKKKLISKKDLDQVERSIIRKQQREQGIFDGRYRTKLVPSGKIYRRKNNSTGEE